MNFITGKHLSRRTFLRGTSASVALPFLDAMVPAGRAWRDPATGFTRLVCLEEDLGTAAGHTFGESRHLFGPAQIGRDFELVPDNQLKPLEAFREYMTIISNTDCRMAEPYRVEETGGDHDRTTSVFLTQAHPLQKAGAVFLGKSLDQVHADRFGQDTVLPSLELTSEGGARGSAYSSLPAWASPTQPLPATAEPRAVFEQLFGAGDSAADRVARIQANKSVLDWLGGELARVRRELGSEDVAALDKYTTDIRELERRIELVEAQNRSGEERAMPEAPSGIPDRWEDHVDLLFELQALALQADITRVITLKYGTQSNIAFPDSGVSKGWHPASHHSNFPAAIMDFNTINTYRLSRIAPFLEKLRDTKEAGVSLLDKSLVMWGSAMGDPNVHNHRKCPLVLIGHANGALEGNLHLKAPDGTPMANAFVNLMQRLGHDDLSAFGDSTGEFHLSFPKGTSVTAEAGQ
jgi:hypothetical protein